MERVCRAPQVQLSQRPHQKVEALPSTGVAEASTDTGARSMQHAVGTRTQKLDQNASEQRNDSHATVPKESASSQTPWTLCRTRQNSCLYCLPARECRQGHPTPSRRNLCQNFCMDRGREIWTLLGMPQQLASQASTMGELQINRGSKDLSKATRRA